MVDGKDEAPQSDDTTDRWRAFLSKGKFVRLDTAALPHKLSDIDPANELGELGSGREGKHEMQEELWSLMH